MAKKKQNLTFDTLMSFVSADTQTAISEGHIQQVRLRSLRPDSKQPRQLLPPDLSAELANGAKPIDIVQQWLMQADEEFANPALIHNIRELRRLADSISQHGLINPVTVRLSDDGVSHQYTIITGERRYWAYVLLQSQGHIIQEGEHQRDANMIPAIVAPEGIRVRAHQLVENLLREDMNAIEKARGIWALREELSADLDKPAPWKAVEEALGVSRQHRTRMINVLDLPEDAQQLVVQYSLTERTIRPIVQLLKERPDLQLIAIKQLASLQQNDLNEEGREKTNLSQAGKRLVDKLLQQSTVATTTPTAPITVLYRKLARSSKLWRNIDTDTRTTLAVQIATSKKRQKTVDELRGLREQVDALLQQIEANG